MNSGFSKEQTLRIIINGIKGYEGKRKRRAALGLPLRSTAAQSRSNRYKKKLLSNANWFKKKKSKNSHASSKDGGSLRREKNKDQDKKEQLKVRSVMFVENTEGGELRSRMKEVIKNLETNLGFTIRVVERNGSSLRSKFPLTNLWEGSMCGRQDCTTCMEGDAPPM